MAEKFASTKSNFKSVIHNGSNNDVVQHATMSMMNGNSGLPNTPSLSAPASSGRTDLSPVSHQSSRTSRVSTTIAEMTSKINEKEAHLKTLRPDDPFRKTLNEEIAEHREKLHRTQQRRAKYEATE